MALAFLVLAQTEQSRILNGCFAIVMGVGVIAYNRTAHSRRMMRRITRFYRAGRAGDAFVVVVHYTYYLAAAFFIVTGVLAVTGIIN